MYGISEGAQAYVAAAIADMQKHGVAVTLATEDFCEFGGGRLGGYFDEGGPTFFVATHASPEVWMSVFIHEYQHFRQWQTKSPTWTAKLDGDCCAWYVFDAWLNGVVELTSKQRDDALQIILECERECETLSLAEIATIPGLGLSSEWYHRAANVYLAWYGVVRLTRQWYQLSPYADESLVTLMPSDRLITIEESLHPSPAVFGAIAARVFSEVH